MKMELCYPMHKILTLIILLSAFAGFSQTLVSGEEHFSRRVIAEGLNDPWSIEIDEEGFLWITESKAYTVSRINPKTGERHLLLDLSDNKNFKQEEQTPWPQGGLMGLALHPEKPWVYIAYVYSYQGNNRFRTRLVRYTYNKTADKLEDPEIISNDIPGSNDHNGGRLLLAKTGNDRSYYLFYSVGDMGAGQYSNGSRPNHAQDLESYEGKVLRFESAPNKGSWIPRDNPFIKSGGRAVWTLGHRNPQGLCVADFGKSPFLFSSEHGPLSDDEVNILRKGKNYGHPLIIGFADGNYNGLAAAVSDKDNLPGSWNTTYPLIESEQENAKSLGNNYQEPLLSFYPTSNSTLVSTFKKIRQGTDADWPSEAPHLFCFTAAILFRVGKTRF